MFPSISFSGRECRHADKIVAFPARTEFSVTTGGELEQIQFLLGHVSAQTTERYLGCKRRIRSAVNDRIGIEPNP